jgi:ATP-grasp domain, R2K clade family 3
MIHWVIQQNLIRADELAGFRKAFETTRTDFTEVYAVPFSDKLPDGLNSELFNIFYGSTTLINNAYRHPKFKKGVFYDDHTFLMQNYVLQWSEKMLNADAIFTDLNRFLQTYTENKSWFIRPNEDSKAFNGTVMSLDEIKAWAKRIGGAETPELNLDKIVCFAKPKPIQKEWRNFVVNGKVVSATRYYVNGKKDVSTADLPAAMLDFVEKCCEIYVPHSIFVMDVALSNGQYFIIECNCFNSTGFYGHDIQRIVEDINQFVSGNTISIS